MSAQDIDSSSGASDASNVSTSPLDKGISTTKSTPGQGFGDKYGDATAKSMEELQEKAPDIFEMMMEGIARQICEKMRKSQERIKQIRRSGG